MSDLSSGAKSGLIAGLIFGIVDGIAAYFIVLSQKAALMAALPKDPSFTQAQIFQAALYGTVFIFLIAGIIIGALIGAAFGAAYRSIPGKTPIIKGLTFAVPLWIVMAILELVSGVGGSPAALGGTLAVDFAGALLYGFVLGVIFNHYKKREMVPEDPFADLMS